MKGFPFNAQQALAVWERKKSVTRRPMKEQPDTSHWKQEFINTPKEWRKQAYLGPQHMSYDPNMWCLFNVGDSYGAVPYTGRKAPYSPGEVVYMQEPWRIGTWDEDMGKVCIDHKDGPNRRWIEVPDPDKFELLWIECTDDAIAAGANVNELDKFTWKPGSSPCRWRSPVTMPQWASRLHLRLTVRPERLWEITEEEVIAEGLIWEDVESDYISASECYRLGFKHLWDSSYGNKYPWKNNDYIWRYGLEEVWRR